MSHKNRLYGDQCRIVYIFNIYVITALFFYHCFFVLPLLCLSNDKLLLSDVIHRRDRMLLQTLVLDSMEMKSEVPVKRNCFYTYSTFHSAYICVDFSPIMVVVYNELWFGN
jgi:hypothetical protein